MKPCNPGGHSACQENLLAQLRKYYPDAASFPTYAVCGSYGCKMCPQAQGAGPSDPEWWAYASLSYPVDNISRARVRVYTKPFCYYPRIRKFSLDRFVGFIRHLKPAKSKFWRITQKH